MIRVLNNLTGQHEYCEEPQTEPIAPPTEADLEAQYKQRVADLVAEVYPLSRESGLQNECMEAVLKGLPAPETYLLMLEYIDKCKDQAHMEVYGVERR